jgi:hypothetical protein
MSRKSGEHGVSQGIRVGGIGSIIIKGNIIVDVKNGIELTNGHGPAYIDYNIVQVRDNEGEYARYGIDETKRYSTLSDWQALGYGMNSLEEYPYFTDTTNVELDLSLMIISPAIDILPIDEAPIDIFNYDINGTKSPKVVHGI